MTYFSEYPLANMKDFHPSICDPEYKRLVLQKNCQDHQVVDCYLETDYNSSGVKKTLRFEIDWDASGISSHSEGLHTTASDTEIPSVKWWNLNDSEKTREVSLRHRRVEFRRRKKTPEMIERRQRIKPFGEASRVSPEDNKSCSMRVDREVLIDPPNADDDWCGGSKGCRIENIYRVLSRKIDGEFIKGTMLQSPDRHQAIMGGLKNKKVASSAKKYVPRWKRERDGDFESSSDNSDTGDGDKKPNSYVPKHLQQRRDGRDGHGHGRDGDGRHRKNGNDRGKPEKSVDTLRVQNLASDMDREELLALFRPYGRVRKVHIVKNNNEESIYAFVHYDFNEEAVKAIRHLDGVPIPGRGVVLSLEWANIRRR